MSDVLTVPTHFADLSELADGLVERVDENKVILYGPEPYEDGAVVQFAVLLSDGSPALEGKGRVLASIDGGEDRAPETRYDVVLDSLELDGRAEVVYERILLASAGEGAGDGPPTGPVAVEDLDAEVAGEPTDDAAEAEVAGEPADHTAEAEAQAAPVDEPAPDFEVADDEATMVADAEAVDVDGAPGAEAVPEAGDAAEDEWADVGADADLEDVAAPAEADDAAEEAQAMPVDAAYEPEAEAAEGSGELGSGVEGGLDVAPDAGDTPAEVEARVMDDTQPMADESAERPVDRDAPEAPVEPAPFEVARMGTNGHALTRPSLALSWEPEALPEPEAGPGSEVFTYQVGELPVPSVPPRPDMDPTLRVAPAPRPGAEEAAQAAAAPAAAEWADHGTVEEPPAEPEWADDGGALDEPSAEPVEATDAAAAEPAADEAATAEHDSEPPEDIDDLDELMDVEDDDPAKQWD
jgi:hypothetical protein